MGIPRLLLSVLSALGQPFARAVSIGLWPALEKRGLRVEKVTRTWVLFVGEKVAVSIGHDPMRREVDVTWFWLDGPNARSLDSVLQGRGGIGLSIVLRVALGGDRLEYSVIQSKQETPVEMLDSFAELGRLVDQCPAGLFTGETIIRAKIDRLTSYLTEWQSGRTKHEWSDEAAMEGWEPDPQEVKEAEERARRWNRI